MANAEFGEPGFVTLRRAAARAASFIRRIPTAAGVRAADLRQAELLGLIACFDRGDASATRGNGQGASLFRIAVWTVPAAVIAKY